MISLSKNLKQYKRNSEYANLLCYKYKSRGSVEDRFALSLISIVEPFKYPTLHLLIEAVNNVVPFLIKSI